MSRTKFTEKVFIAISLSGLFALGSVAQSQPDSQAGAQLGEQSALSGKQNQGANTQKTTELSPSNETTLAAGTALRAELTNALDSKKVKQGDPVNAKMTDALKSQDGRVVLPQGTKLVGHVTQASARSAGASDSSLGLVIEKAQPKNGPEVPLNVSIQAVAAPQSSGAYAGDYSGPQPSSGGAYGGSSRAPGGGGQSTAPTTNRPTAPNGVPDNSAGAGNTMPADNAQLNTSSRGVIGLNNLSLNSSAGTQGAVIVSNGKNVHLDSGTRLLLVAQASVNHSAASENPVAPRP
jgi:hypothetical protein